MKRERLDIKKIIKKRNEEKRKDLNFIERRRTFKGGDEFKNLTTAKSIPKEIVKPINVSLLSNFDRSAVRAGNYTSDSVTYLPILENKEPVSIIITAYKTQNYIEECLDSIEAQTYFINNNNYEVLVGVDACQDTLDKLLEIRHKYRNLRIFMMKSNKGTYITTNTLLDLVQNENVVRFDSDDIMKREFINEIMVMSGGFDVVRIKCVDFRGDSRDKQALKYERYAAGVIFYKKSIFNIFGGYESWICAADSELIERMKDLTNVGYLNKVLFFRRVHENSLSQKTDTNIRSEIRGKYRKMIYNNKRNNHFYVKKIVNVFSEIINVKHVVVVRLAIKWRYEEVNLSWDEWVKNTIYLMDNFCRPSLKNQKNQDFTILSIVDESIFDYGNVLDNEVILKVNNNGDLKDIIINAINKYVSELKGYDAVIVTRLDRDDCLRNDFIEKVKRHLSSNTEQYVDLNHSFTYDVSTKKAYKSNKYNNTFVSPFVSIFENIINSKIRCVSFLVEHPKVPTILSGKKVNDLYGMQVIHDYNLKNKIVGKITKINLNNFGING